MPSGGLFSPAGHASEGRPAEQAEAAEQAEEAEEAMRLQRAAGLPGPGVPEAQVECERQR